MTMYEYKSLRAALLIFDVLRLTILIFLFTFILPSEGDPGTRLFPYLVYAAPNALFPLMTLFLFIRFSEFKNFLPLYLAGKIITVVTFYVWGITSLGAALSEAYFAMNMKSIYILLAGNLALSLGDLLSILGTWFLISKTKLFRRPVIADNNPIANVENGGL